jgi:hypothetical protein
MLQQLDAQKKLIVLLQLMLMLLQRLMKKDLLGRLFWPSTTQTAEQAGAVAN